MMITCREVQSLLPLFFDSELDSRQMRVVALHTAKCPSCEPELRQLENLQEVVSRTLSERVEEIDLSNIWTNVEQRLGRTHLTWTERARLWWSEEQPLHWLMSGPAIGAAIAGFALALLLLANWQPHTVAKSTLAQNNGDSAVSIETIDAPSNVALLSENDTLVLWVDDAITDQQMSPDQQLSPEDLQ